MGTKKLYDQEGREFDNDIGAAGLVVGYAIVGFIVLLIAELFGDVISLIALLVLIVGIIISVKELPSGVGTRIIVSLFLAFISSIFISVVFIQFTNDFEAAGMGDTGGVLLFIILVVVSITTAPSGDLTPHRQGQEPQRYIPRQRKSIQTSTTYQQPQPTYNYSTPTQSQKQVEPSRPEPRQIPKQQQVQMVYCPNCGESQSGKFCGICGSSLE